MAGSGAATTGAGAATTGTGAGAAAAAAGMAGLGGTPPPARGGSGTFRCGATMTGAPGLEAAGGSTIGTGALVVVLQWCEKLAGHTHLSCWG